MENVINWTYSIKALPQPGKDCIVTDGYNLSTAFYLNEKEGWVFKSGTRLIVKRWFIVKNLKL